ncbi:MAG: PfkB family carbohydrate kinase [Thermodesulfobacteriota bacterium]
MSSFDVVGIGQVCVDYLGVVNRHPSVDERQEITQLSTLRGGPTATALNVLSRFGLKVALVSKIGDDTEGKRLIQELEQESIDTTHLIVEPGKKTQVSLIPIEKHSGKRTVFWSRGTTTPLTAADIPTDILQNTHAVHFDDLYAGAALRAIEAVGKEGLTVSFDAGEYNEAVEYARGDVDILIASVDFMKSYSGGDDPRKCLEKMSEFGAAVIAITLGDRGSITSCGGEIIDTPAYNVSAVDTTGAGDVFRGAFLYGRLMGWEVEESLPFASAAAAMNTLSLGATGGIPESPEAVFAFMKSHETRPVK